MDTISGNTFMPPPPPFGQTQTFPGDMEEVLGVRSILSNDIIFGNSVSLGGGEGTGPYAVHVSLDYTGWPHFSAKY
jgi:hypothetical protein